MVATPVTEQNNIYVIAKNNRFGFVGHIVAAIQSNVSSILGLEHTQAGYWEDGP